MRGENEGITPPGSTKQVAFAESATMNIDELIGYFTYRSFQNQPTGTANEIL